MTANDSPERVSIEALLAHREWVRALARSLYFDRNDADDLEQETWRMALERPPRHATSLRAWFATAVRNAAGTVGRKERTRSARESAAAPRAPSPSPADAVAAAELLTKLARAVLELDEPYRTTVVLRYFEGLESTEIAARLSISVETVRTRLKRAIDRLRRRMGVEIGEDRDAWCLLVFGRRAAAVKAATATGGVAAAAGGGLAMAAATKVVVAAVVVVAAGATWWAWSKSDVMPKRRETASVVPADTQTRQPGGRARRTSVPADESSPVAAPTLTAPSEVPLGPDVVHGRVIDDESSAAVAKVTVSLVWDLAQRTGKEPSVVTGDDGTFRVAGAKDGDFGELLLQCEGYAECLVDLPWRDQYARLAKNDAGDVRICRGRKITGHVLAADGVTPVAGASVRLSTSGGSSSTMWAAYARERATSDASGAFTMERVPPSHTHWPYTVFAVAKDGIGWAKLPGDAGRADTEGVAVSLRSSGAATVTVRDEAGAPQAGVQVAASPRFEPLGPKPEWDVGHDVYVADGTLASLFLAKTDAQGVARLPALPTVEERPVYDFIACATAAGARAWKSAAVRAPDVATVEIVVAAPKIRAVLGMVHGTDAAPVDGAKIRTGRFPRQSVTGPDGRFRLEGYDASWGDQDWIEATADGFARLERSIKVESKKDVLELDLALKPAAPIAGRVVDQDGKPVAGATVSTPRDDASINGRYATTDDAGRFAFADTAAGEWRLTLRPPPPDDEWEFMPVAIVHGGDKDVVLVQRRAAPGNARLVVTVLDDSGAPLAPDQVSLNPAEEGASAAYAAHGKTELANGRVVVERMKPGRWRMWLHFPDRLGTVVPVDVVDGQTEVSLRVVVGKPGVLRGRVDVGDSGAPMPSMVVPELVDDGQSPQWARPHGPNMVGAARVGVDGTFEFPEVIPGRWRVWTQGDGYIGEGLGDVPAGGSGTCVVAVTRPGTVSIRLESQPPSTAVECWFGRESGPMRRRLSGSVTADKLPTLECPLPPGRWRWRVSFPVAGSWGTTRVAAETQEGEIVVSAGETSVVGVAVVPK